MYRVKLSKKTSDEITVDGIIITHKWTQIKEKSKALEELEKKGIIIIEEISKATRQMMEESGATKGFLQMMSESGATKGIVQAIIEGTAASVISAKRIAAGANKEKLQAIRENTAAFAVMKATRICLLAKMSPMQCSPAIFNVSSLAAIGIKDVVPKSLFSTVEPSKIATLADKIKELSKSLNVAYGFSSKLSSMAEALKSIVKPIKEYQLAAQMNPLGNEFIKIGEGLGVNAIVAGTIKSFSEIQKKIYSKTISNLEEKKKILTELETIAIGFDPGFGIDKKELERLLIPIIDFKPVETREKSKDKIDYKQKYEEIKVKVEKMEMENKYQVQVMENRYQAVESKNNQLYEEMRFLKEIIKAPGVDSKNATLKKAYIKKITWVKTPEQLVFIIRQLSGEGFLLDAEGIGVDKMITNHFVTTEGKSFSKEENINRIRWVGTLSQLVFFIGRLFKHKFLSKADIYEIDNLIYNHFGDSEGNPFKKGSIKSTRHRIKIFNKNKMVKGGEKILEIIKKAENMKE